MSPQDPKNRRLDGNDSLSRPGGTDQLPPYSGKGQEPGDQIAEQWVSAADHAGEHAVSDITTGAIASHDHQKPPIPGRADPLTDPRKPVDSVFADPEAHIHDSTDQNDADERSSMETFTEKEGGTPLPASVPRDPASPGVGPVSRGLVAIVVLVLLLILIAVIVSLL